MSRSGWLYVTNGLWFESRTKINELQISLFIRIDFAASFSFRFPSACGWFLNDDKDCWFIVEIFLFFQTIWLFTMRIHHHHSNFPNSRCWSFSSFGSVSQVKSSQFLFFRMSRLASIEFLCSVRFCADWKKIVLKTKGKIKNEKLHQRPKQIKMILRKELNLRIYSRKRRSVNCFCA